MILEKLLNKRAAKASTAYKIPFGLLPGDEFKFYSPKGQEFDNILIMEPEEDKSGKFVSFGKGSLGSHIGIYKKDLSDTTPAVHMIDPKDAQPIYTGKNFQELLKVIKKAHDDTLPMLLGADFGESGQKSKILALRRYKNA